MQTQENKTPDLSKVIDESNDLEINTNVVKLEQRVGKLEEKLDKRRFSLNFKPIKFKQLSSRSIYIFWRLVFPIIIFLVIFAILYFTSEKARAADIFIDIFPQSIEQRIIKNTKQVELEYWEKNEYGAQKRIISYYGQDEQEEISISITQLENKENTNEYMENMIKLTVQSLENFQNAESGDVYTANINNYESKYFYSIIGQDYEDYYYKNQLNFYVSFNNFLVAITIAQDQNMPSLNTANNIAKTFINKLEERIGKLEILEAINDSDLGVDESLDNENQDLSDNLDETQKRAAILKLIKGSGTWIIGIIASIFVLISGFILRKRMLSRLQEPGK
ncbi:MAG: hypothetical protein ISS87_00290 [Candidatus Pacebacteria bacterium]|nr:hypothetical protein [Candidatus Paceibacterota bacterium]